MFTQVCTERFSFWDDGGKHDFSDANARKLCSADQQNLAQPAEAWIARSVAPASQSFVILQTSNAFRELIQLATHGTENLNSPN